jgi:hypothetical protein
LIKSPEAVAGSANAGLEADERSIRVWDELATVAAFATDYC